MKSSILIPTKIPRTLFTYFVYMTDLQLPAGTPHDRRQRRLSDKPFGRQTYVRRCDSFGQYRKLQSDVLSHNNI